jgi:two-component system response regulator YesN
MLGVIVVEDEPYIRKGIIMTTPWKEFGCEVIGEAKDGKEGYDLICRLNPDIVITDVDMPVKDGIEMIRALYKFIKSQFIIISGYNDFNYAQQAIKLGVKDYLLKPIDDDDFYKTLKRLSEEIRKEKTENKHSKEEIYLDAKENLAREINFDKNSDGRKFYVTKAKGWVKEHYKENISINDAALELGISESYLSRLFKNYMGYTFVEYLTDYRIKMAIELLKDHSIKVYEVAEKVGYHDPKYFSIIFKKRMGITPMCFKSQMMTDEE